MTDMLTKDRLHVLDGIETHGHINTPPDQLVANVRHSIRLGHTQVKPQPLQADRICLVGGGPSLDDTFDELRTLYFEGAKIVTVNGAYHWCLERNLRPSMQIVLDAKPSNVRFVNPAVPRCQYLLASQCDRALWDAVDGREGVWIWHGAATDNEQLKPILDAYYAGAWTSTPGGTTVIVRAILLLRILGFVRMDLFGVDACLMGGKHHAYAQPENDDDSRRARVVTLSRDDQPGASRAFLCAPWHLKSLECMLQTIRLHGEHFALNVHGEGMIAYALKLGAGLQVSEAL